MKSEWESMAIDKLFALREQMQEVLSAKLKAKKGELERRTLLTKICEPDLNLAKRTQANAMQQRNLH